MAQGVDLEKLQLVQSVGVRFRPGETDPAGLHEPCRLSFVELDESKHKIQELQAEEFQVTAARALNDFDVIIGSGRPGPGRPDWIPWRSQNGIVEPLGFVGSASVINDAGVIAGTDFSENPVQHGIRLSGGAWERIEARWMSPKGMCSTFNAHAMNTDGVIAGQLDRIELGRGCQFSVPAVLYPDGRVDIAPADEGMVGSPAMSID